MATTNINIRVDTELKQAAEELFKDLGLNLSSAINMFLRSAVNQDGIPFEIKRNKPNAVTKAALAEREAMRSNPEEYKRYSNFDELLKDIE